MAVIDEATKADARRRLLSIRGQVQGILQMVEDEKYCVDILIQLSAVKAALEKVSAIILKRHVESCVAEVMASGDEEAKMEKIDELIDVFTKFGK